MEKGKYKRLLNSRPGRSLRRRSVALLAGFVLLLAASPVPGIGSRSAASASEGIAAEPVTSGGPNTLRRLNEAQYKASIAAIFGPRITVPGRFEPPVRDEGLLAIGEGRAIFSAAGVEQNELRARQIAAQVLADEARDSYLGCSPRSPVQFDDACASKFLGRYGRLLFRRPLTKAELTSAVEVARISARSSKDFFRGLETGLSRLLQSPHFLFRVERSVADPTAPGARRLDDFSLASRISFLLWNAPPDEALLDAAESGSLGTQAGLERQVDRMLASPRFEMGVRAFFSDMFAFDRFEGLSKEQSIYQKYTSKLANAAKEQMLRTIVDHLVTNGGDYRKLFTTKKTFLERDLAALYKVALSAEAGLNGWAPYTFGEDDPRAGILTLAGFLMLDPTHEGRSSPTIRGMFVREQFLCQPVPAPPGDVDFSTFEAGGRTVNTTARDRLSAHREDPVCAGCHAITDPIGLALENYDAIGQFRTHENGALIDASGEFDGESFKSAIELQRLLSQSPTTPVCVTQRALEYGLGRPLTPGEDRWLEFAIGRFVENGYSFPALMRLVATSKAFRTVSAGSSIAAK